MRNVYSLRYKDSLLQSLVQIKLRKDRLGVVTNYTCFSLCYLFLVILKKGADRLRNNDGIKWTLCDSSHRNIVFCHDPECSSAPWLELRQVDLNHPWSQGGQL